MRVLLLGANGQLGRTFINHGGLAARGALSLASRDGQLDNGSCEIADLSLPNTLVPLLDRVQPEVVINAAAYTAVDRAENQSDLANRVNGEAVKVMGHWAAAHAAKVIHYSTDYVFDGRQSTPYGPDSPTAPLGAYGRSKLQGELALRDSGADHLTLRTSWVYAAHGQNFLRTMLRLGAERDQLRVVADQRGAPTDTGLIVRATLAALDRWLSDSSVGAGTYHLVASGDTTWHGFATAIFDLAYTRGLFTRKPTILAIETKDFPTAAQRPACSILDNTNFIRDFGFDLPHWQNGLIDVMDQIANKGHTNSC